MFSSKQKTPSKSDGGIAPKAPAAPSIISSDLTINGNLTSEGDVQVDGTVEGDIISNKLTVSSTATVRGAIEAETVVIAGHVTGQIKARHVTLAKTARVIADVIQERLSIEPGAFFEGNCRHFPTESDKKSLPKLEPVKPAVAKQGNGAAIPVEATP
ncbi:polymer-forming cytoskeletal protein [Thalassobaculum sp. OXR-137]|uniref:bactofilin family protein n=1 Tax=Thalassobaculum sp. OXR-137 TaxID=3100173 RepID=UPI002AC90721|nr:polymer-forming cytoskeletal protein [Thalassobaculum sp. OXR-137]WPZ32882.1 polymer-forming cytoskeletal protein [Thalassobaculum sp. OXR-137]